jgi:hypothetical protein
MTLNEILTSLFWLVVIGYFTYLVWFARSSVRSASHDQEDAELGQRTRARRTVK